MHGETKPEVQFLLRVSVCVCVWLSKSMQAYFVHICILLVLCEVYCIYNRKSTFYRLCWID